MNTQLIIYSTSKRVLCTAFGRGQEHAFVLFKRSRCYFDHSTETVFDSGYQDLCSLHKKSVLSRKQIKGRLMPKWIKKRFLKNICLVKWTED